ncbi:MAG: TonB-dependent receptor plug domain-containing protein, partial [Chitinophagaceae bacterium]
MRFLLLFKNFGPGKIICKGFFFLLLLVAFDAGAQQVSLTLKEASLESVFSEIKKQTGFNFVYTSEEIKKSKPVTITLRNIPLKEALNQIFQNQPLGFTLEENYIVIHVKPEEPRKNDYEIRGKVVDEKGEGISSASIRLKDTKEGTATDDAGNFLIKSEKENIILQISSVGYENREVLASASRVQSIELKTEYNQLDETVVIAYGTTTRRLNTGSVSKISSEVISQQPVLNPISAIQGRAPGVFVTTLNGLPGGNIKVEIRGRGSVSAGTEPLYIVDGVPYSSTPLNKGFSDFIAVNGEISPLNNINPLDIESIEVLKDADATAIYGSRGANGVILITTKKGRGGKTNFNINVSQGVSKIAVLPQLLNLQQYLQLRREGFVNDNRTPSNNTAPELMLWDTTKFTNWPKYIWGGTANVTNIYSSITGGNLNTTFLLSGYFRREGSILPGNEKYSRVGGLA